MKTTLIIGASSGIGKALTGRLAGSGENVIGTYHTKKIEGDSFHPFDVLAGVTPSFIPETLDGFVYCPGSIVLKPFGRVTAQELLKDYELQVTGMVTVLQKALPALKKSGAASVVLFSTVAVQTGFPFHSVVSASKGAVEGVMRALAAELAPSIRVNCIAPSITDTPLASSLLSNDEKRNAAALRHPMKQIGNPDHIAALAQFLLSEQASWITGQVLKADGGVSALKIG